MLYNLLKIIHILSGSVVFCTLIGTQSYGLWCVYQPADQQKQALFTQSLHQTILPIVILSILFQILSGFTLISLHHISWHALWIKASLIGLILLLINWCVFTLYSMKTFYRGIMSLGLSIGILSGMIYFMANQTT